MRISRLQLAIMLLVVTGAALPRSAAAYPNMIRLGYATCAACHLSPQGGGVLTPYGRGIDFAQTLREDEPPDAEGIRNTFLRRLLYDARLQVGVSRQQGTPANEYSLGATARAAIPVHEQHRLVYSFSVRSPSLST